MAKTALAAAFLLGTARDSSAEVYSFSCISSSVTDCGILEAQIQVEVTAVAPNRVAFRFTNTGSGNSSIADIYFDDLLPALLGTPLSIIDSGAGVAFSAGCSPGNLPGGNPYGFTSSYCTDSNSPVQPNGVNPGEWVQLTYTLQGGATFANVINALNAGTYVIGVHVQGFADGGSVSGITNGSVPEPTSLVFVTTGLLLGGWRLRRRRKA